MSLSNILYWSIFCC